MRFKKGYLLLILPAIALISFIIYNLSIGVGIAETFNKSFQAAFYTLSIVWAIGFVTALLSIPLTRIFKLEHLSENERFVITILCVLLITSAIFNYNLFSDTRGKSNDIIRLNSQLDTERKENTSLKKTNDNLSKLNLPPVTNKPYNSYNYSKPKVKIKPKKEYETSYRIGAECWDGTFSSATGRGACSWHGGVKRWIYNTDK